MTRRRNRGPGRRLPWSAGLVAGWLALAGALPATGAPPASSWLLSPDFGRDARAVRTGQPLRVEDVPLEDPRVGVPGLGWMTRAASAPVGSLDLRRVEVFSGDASIVLHERGRDVALDVPDTAYFAGVIDGRPGSFAFLAVDEAGRTRGLLSDGDGMWGVGSEDGTTTVTLVDANEPLGEAAAPWACGNEDEDRAVPALDSGLAAAAALSPEDPAPAAAAAAATIYVADLAIETDAEFYQLFGSGQEAVDYVGDLFAAMSAIYERDVGAVLRVTYLSLWADGPASDPWTATSTSGGLDEFMALWRSSRGNVPRTVAHFLSGRQTGGGVAYVGTLCSNTYGYGFTGGIDGAFSTTNPGLFWDIMGVSHEIGHNFGSGHTHCYSPPVDQCYGAQGGCYSGPTSVPSNGGGSIMSYCHLKSGGYSNISLWFGRQDYYGQDSLRVPAVMRSRVESALCMEELVDPPLVSLSATPSEIEVGATSLLEWEAVDAEGCEFVQGATGTHPPSGSLEVQPTVSRTYEIECTGPGGTTSAQVDVTVNRPQTLLSLQGTVVRLVGPIDAPARIVVKHSVGPEGDVVDVQDRKTEIMVEAGAPCVPVRRWVRCTGAFTGIEILLGDERDRVTVRGSLPAYIDGGGERDTLRGGDGDDTLLGGEGRDRLFGRGGADFLEGDGGNDRADGGAGDDVIDGGMGADVLIGREGIDTVMYPGRSGPVSVTYDDVPNDGEEGEGDNVRSSVELAG